VRYQARVVRVTYYDSCDPLSAAVGVECIGCFPSFGPREDRDEKGMGEQFTFLFNILPLAGLRTLRDCLAEHGHELAIARDGRATVAA
jgi:hypothetical protein